MKTQLIYTVLVVLFFMASCSSTKPTVEKTLDVKNKVQSKDFTLNVNYANPMSGHNVYLTSGYDLRIKNDSAFAYLPYYGRAYSASYGGDGGIQFAEPMSGYIVEENKKSDRWNIHFSVKSKVDSYVVYIHLFNNGTATVSVNSTNRQTITFNGELKD